MFANAAAGLRASRFAKSANFAERRTIHTDGRRTGVYVCVQFARNNYFLCDFGTQTQHTYTHMLLRCGERSDLAARRGALLHTQLYSCRGRHHRHGVHRVFSGVTFLERARLHQQQQVRLTRINLSRRRSFRVVLLSSNSSSSYTRED